MPMPNLEPPSPPSSAGPRFLNAGPAAIDLRPGPPPPGRLRSDVCAGLPDDTAASTASASASPAVSTLPSVLPCGFWLCWTTWVSSCAVSAGDGEADLKAT